MVRPRLETYIDLRELTALTPLLRRHLRSRTALCITEMFSRTTEIPKFTFCKFMAADT